jgi:hypothetical protein
LWREGSVGARARRDKTVWPIWQGLESTPQELIQMGLKSSGRHAPDRLTHQRRQRALDDLARRRLVSIPMDGHHCKTEHTYTNLTAGDLVEYLKHLPAETEIHIEGFTFYRWKWRGDNLLALELDPVDPNHPILQRLKS